MYTIQRKLLSQNFLYSRKLVSQLVDNSSIGKNDLVYEIGPGKGIITEQLIAKARHVIAVELDNDLCKYLQEKFQPTSKFLLFNYNAAHFPLPYQPYKVFSNIPFAIEGELIRKLIDNANPPQDCYLVIVQELAERLCAFHRENLFSILHKPWFDFSIEYYFKPTDFTPVPKVRSALFRFKQKSNQLIPLKEKQRYQEFVTIGFGQGDLVKNNFSKKYGKEKVSRLFKQCKLDQNVKPSYLKLEEWIHLYNLFFKTR